jgi:hypothetical protein
MSEVLVNNSVVLPMRSTVGAVLPQTERRQPPFLPRRTGAQTDTRRESNAKPARSRLAFAPNAAPTLVDTSAQMPAARTEASPWRARIPAGAIFYDDMDRLTAGVDQPGLLVSVRV